MYMIIEAKLQIGNRGKKNLIGRSPLMRRRPALGWSAIEEARDLLLLLLFNAMEFSLDGSSPYTQTKTNKNKYT
jgi:hypothetical protein